MAVTEMHPIHRHRRRHRGVYVLGVILILLFIGIAWIALVGTGPAKLTSGTTFNLGVGSVASYTLQNNSKSFAIYLHNSSAGYAGIDVAMYPVLANPTVAIYAANGSAYNISTFGQGNADVNIRIVSSNATSARLQLTPIPVGLSFGVSPGVMVLQPSPIPTGLQTVTTVASSGATTVSTTIKATTTVASGSGSTTTVAPTTTVVAGVPASIYSTINASYLGSLMVKLNKLYIAGQACTPPLYNQTMLQIGQPVVIGNDFANVTLFTPKYVTLTATDVSSGYEAIYNITTPSSQTSGVILTFGITSLGTISNVTFKGLWTGVNYTQLATGYQTQSVVTNACAAYIP